MKDRASESESRWRRWGRNLLLTLGIAQLAGYLSFALHYLLGLLISTRIFSGALGVEILDVLQSLPAIVAAAFAGYFAAYFLTYRRAAWAIFAVGASWAIAGLLGALHDRHPEGWELAVVIARAVLISVLLPLLFLLKRRSLCAEG